MNELNERKLKDLTDKEYLSNLESLQKIYKNDNYVGSFFAKIFNLLWRLI